jgi:hypothetical protein
MWSRLGDASEGPPGTFYREKTAHLLYYWNTFDQVLLRPELFGAFSTDRLKVLERIGNADLLKDGIVDKDSGSDHLPLLIGLDV